MLLMLLMGVHVDVVVRRAVSIHVDVILILLPLLLWLMNLMLMTRLIVSVNIG